MYLFLCPGGKLEMEGALIVIRRLIGMLILFVITITLLALAIANRHEVRLVLDPFDQQNPAFYLSFPLFGFLLVMLALGAFIGGMASWLSQGKWRQMARRRTREAMRWKAEAERLASERDNQVSNQRRLSSH